MGETARRVLLVASLVAVALTLPQWLRAAFKAPAAEAEAQRAIRKARLEIWNTPVAEGRCAIDVAHFGGGRARLVRAEKEGTVHYAVVESVHRSGPMGALQQGDWLRANFGEVETVTLAIYQSAATAMARAGQLCPPRFRCLPGRPGCGTDKVWQSPMDVFGTPSADTAQGLNAQFQPPDRAGWPAWAQPLAKNPRPSDNPAP